MFIYHPQQNLSLKDYGIFVPLLDTRAQFFYQYLEENIRKSLIDNKLYSNLQAADLKDVHNHDFIERLTHSPDKEIIKTFELVDDEGNLNRYDPAKAKHPLKDLMRPILAQTEATAKACEYALESGFSYNLGGGLHHAMSHVGRGFCQVNDIVYAARKIQTAKNLKSIWIIDTDAHKGDGTAEITHGDDSLVTLSIHMQDGWPMDSGKFDSAGNIYPWFIQSNVDVAVAKGDDQNYLKLLEQGLNKLEQNYPKPDLALIVQGSDPYEKDELISAQDLQLTKEQLLARDMLVYHFLKEKNIPQAHMMSGGYGRFSHEIYIQFIEKIKNEL